MHIKEQKKHTKIALLLNIITKEKIKRKMKKNNKDLYGTNIVEVVHGFLYYNLSISDVDLIKKRFKATQELKHLENLANTHIENKIKGEV